MAEKRDKPPGARVISLTEAKQSPARRRPEPVKAASGEWMTDLGNARQLVRRHGADFRYVPLWDKWLAWRDGHWWRDIDGAIVRAAKATAEEMLREAFLLEDPDARGKAMKHALDTQKASRLKGMIMLAESELPVILPVERIDCDPLLLGVANGVIDLRNQSFREARKEDYITKRAGVAHDPKARCPAWEAFLARIHSAPGMVDYIQRCFGYVLTGQTGEEVAFILWGGGANGKSTLRETLFALMGDYAVASDAALLTAVRQAGQASAATPEVARLLGMRLVTINETSDGDVLNESRVKFITSHDKLNARGLYQDPFDFTPTHKTMLTTQHKPIIKGTDEGIWRRLQLWAFLHQFPEGERDINFRERVLIPEMAGILNWALKGLRSYQQCGLNPPEAVRAATSEYRKDMDLVGQWIGERCILDPGAQALSRDLHLNYKQWSEDEIGFSLSPKRFSQTLIERGFRPVYFQRGRGFRGLRLLF